MFKLWFVEVCWLKQLKKLHALQVPYRYPTGTLQVLSPVIPNLSLFRILWLRQERFLQLFGDDAPSRSTLQTFLHEAVSMVPQNEPDLHTIQLISIYAVLCLTTQPSNMMIYVVKNGSNNPHHLCPPLFDGQITMTLTQGPTCLFADPR